MKIILSNPPIENFSWKNNISQLFGVSAERYKKEFGLPAHNGIDIISYFGDAILATHDGTIEMLRYDAPHRTSGNGIFILSKDKTFSTIYWHLSQFADFARVGAEVKSGQFIGNMGNSGTVWPLPTQDFPRNGTHLHFGVLIHGLVNEYSGFIDPTPCLFKQSDKLPVYWPADLMIGSSGNYVSWLQTILKLEGLADDYEPISYFGKKTMRDVIKLQERNQLLALGYFGAKTREIVKKYSLFYP